MDGGGGRRIGMISDFGMGISEWGFWIV